MQATELGARLREMRRDAGISSRELGKLAGVSAALVGHIERGYIRAPRSGTLIALARVLGCSLEHLLLGAGDRPSEEGLRAAVEKARAMVL